MFSNNKKNERKNHETLYVFESYKFFKTRGEELLIISLLTNEIL